MRTYPYKREEFNGPNLWAIVKQSTGTDTATLEQTLDALEAAGIPKGDLDGAFELIQNSGLVSMNSDCDFTEGVP